MAIAYDASSSVGATTNTSVSWNHTVGSGKNRILFVAYGCGASGQISSVTYNGVAMTRVGSETTNNNMGLFMLVNPASGTHAVQINLSSSQYIYGGAVSYSGAKQTGQPDSSNVRNASGTTSGNISTTVVKSGCWLVGVFNAASSGVTGGTNATIRTNLVNSERGIFDSNGIVGTGSQTANMTSAGNASWGEVVASFSPFVDNPGNPIFFKGGYAGG